MQVPSSNDPPARRNPAGEGARGGEGCKDGGRR